MKRYESLLNLRLCDLVDCFRGESEGGSCFDFDEVGENSAGIVLWKNRFDYGI